MNMKHSLTTYTLIVLTLAVAGATGCGKKSAATGPKVERSLPIRVQAAAPRTFERRITVQGTLEAKNFANVAARIEGNLDSVWVDEGDTVKAGETKLFQIDPVGRKNALTIAEQALEVARANLKVAEATVEQARAGARKAETDFERYARLRKEAKVTANEFEQREMQNIQAQSGLEVAKAHVMLSQRQVGQAEAALAIAKKNLSDSLVVAPISGAVSKRSAEPGEQMSIGRVILRIDDLSVIEAAAYFPAQYYGEVTPGQTQFRLAVGGKDAGTYPVEYRSPTINTTLRTFEIKGRVDATSGIAVPGRMADITLIFETREGLGIPSSAVLIRNNEPTVFVVRDGKAQAQTVKTGLQNDGSTEVLSGLKAGDQVVTEGQTQLNDGMPVDIR